MGPALISSFGIAEGLGMRSGLGFDQVIPHPVFFEGQLSMLLPTGHTHYYAILAHPVTHTKAVEFFNPRFQAAGRDAFLIPMHILPEDLEETLAHLVKVRNLKGFVVTIPHKPAMARICQKVGEAGRLTGTVNTVRIEPDGSLSGEMFDGLGLVEGCRAHGMDPRRGRVLMVGCGGAGRAIAFALAQAGAKELVLHNRTMARAEELAREVAVFAPNCKVLAGPADGRGMDLVIQATSLGLNATDPLPIDPQTLDPGSAFCDIIAVRDTEIMAAAEARGCRVIGGRPMVDHQIAAQIEFLDPPKL